MSNKTNQEENTRIGQMLQSARESRRVTQSEMESAVNLTKNYISAMEKGRSKASVSTLLGYCRKLDMTPNEILGFMRDDIPSELKSEIRKLTEEEQQALLAFLKSLDL